MSNSKKFEHTVIVRHQNFQVSYDVSVKYLAEIRTWAEMNIGIQYQDWDWEMVNFWPDVALQFDCNAPISKIVELKLKFS